MRVGTKTLASIAACVTLSALAFSPARAWESAYHMGMIQVTQNIFHVPGIMASDKMFVFSTKAREACYTDGEKKSVREKLSAKDRVWLELICGTNDPDEERRRWSNIAKADFYFHNADAEKRAISEFNEAVSAYRNPRLGNAVAANHLGRSIHYLQDLIDFSKHFDKDDDAKRIRSYGEALAKRYLNETANPGGKPGYPKWLAAALRPIRQEFAGPPPTPKAFIGGSLEGREELAKVFKEEVRGPDRNRKRDLFIEKMTLFTIVGQEQWISMYLRYIGVAEPPIP